MRNLALVGERRHKVSIHKDVDPSSSSTRSCRRVVAMCQTEGDGLDLQQGNNSGATFILTNDGIVAKLLLMTTNTEDSLAAFQDDDNEQSSSQQEIWMTPLNASCEQPTQNGWFQMSMVDSTHEGLLLVCLSHSGAIVTVDPMLGQAELVGEFDHGIQAASFSPDGEALCLLTFSEPEDEEDNNKAPQRNSVLLLMNTQWEVLAETTIDSHIPYQLSETDSSVQSSSSMVSMCWRPDGSLVAVSTVDVANQMRKIRIFKRDNLTWHAIGRTEDGSGKLVPNILPTKISWAGAGCSQLLTAAQQKGTKTLQIVFFEPNGNRHREFVLRENAATTQVLGLTWNVESDLLAVTLRDGEATCDKVQLWHRSNYHWYLKQEFRFNTQQLARVVFDEEKPHLLYIFFDNALEWWEYDVQWQPSSIQLLASKTCAAYVVDGALLHMTALDQAMVPPPMYAFTLNMTNFAGDSDCPIRQVLLSHDDSKSITAIVRLSDESIVLIGNPLQSNGRTGRFATPSIVAKGSLKNDLEGRLDCTALRSFVLVEQSDTHIRVLAVSSAAITKGSTLGGGGIGEYLVTLIITWNETEKIASIGYSSNHAILMEKPVMCVAPWSDSQTGAVVELDNGKVFEFEIAQDGIGSLHPLDAHEFMEPCSWIAGLKNTTSLLEDPSRHHNDNFQERNRLVIGLSRRSRLFCQDVLLADAVSSFFMSVAHQYLCYVAAQGATSQLRFLPLRDLHHFDALMGSDGNVLLEGYEPRSVERGSRLVAIFPGSPTAVLQLPRGNLEGVYPRALILRFVMNKISTGNYGEAFSMMRRQKVNLNLIVDVNPKRFLEDGILLLLKQVTAIDHLNLFISCLQNWDSTQTQYRIPPWLDLVPEQDVAAKKIFDFSSKVNQVCMKLRSYMLLVEKNGRLEGGSDIAEGHFLLPILTTFAKENPPKLEEALTLIKENAIAKSNQSTAPSKKPPMFSDAAQSSIQYLAFLADHELIFNVGLGLYDFDIARACARNSQMDPKVYLPLLKRLRSIPKFYGRYEVDMRLKRYEKALRNLFESGQNDESLEEIEPVQLDETVDPPSSVGNGFENCMSLIENYRLHGIGLELFKHDNERKRMIMSSLGQKLLKEGKAEAALTVFLSTEPVDIGHAKEAARACRNWKCFFTLAFQSSDIDKELEESLRRSAAREMAEGITLTSENHYNLQSDFNDAARIVLDYCNDVEGAVDMLIKGWLWHEGCRVAALHLRPDLVQKCIDAAVLYAETLQSDLEDRKTTFLTTIIRYEEVLEIRKEAIRSGEQQEDQFVDEETGSLFSAASHASNMSLQSAASTDSLSSVISIKSVSSFTITGREEETRHRSRFNQMGGGKKKKKKKKNKPGKNKIRPGSVEELQSLVDMLRGSCGDKDFCRVISDTMEFLSQTGRSIDLARELFQSYVDMSEAIEKCTAARLEARETAQLTGLYNTITLPVEEQVNRLSCPKLSDSLYEVFSIL